ncbi:rhamnogalacturonan acetylesterase [Pseudoxanthomonas broegbernensis]|uniref:Rhamnogalacturonan acetylesterase n=1 Tax=Pseudoxanthomonas broegbernensis TaxID=83619 RepID=A0A7V8GN05_9GAMM|nr:GDSL-type esterase/lipase family protein [Pseudoxanthomonas broegbernensis]KAF1686820.1 rhamnogalacturonan acetylesterase [Pseudoxanthomonas broegbernensis]MBB6065596.1 lysophospholipase L1-like esterase/mannose-6-phosphate isomerase-like protein (cupin superfamily) [Pseudoxanthomonas broegbernensis]
MLPHRPLRWLLPILLGLPGPATATATAATPAAPHRVFLAGDSTVAEYGPERAPRNGWGQRLQDFLDPAAYQVRNRAVGGRSSRSFVEEGRLQPIARELRRGDVLLVQFGHNDAKYEDPRRYADPARAYPQWLMRYVDLARARGATPILVTPVARRLFDHGALLDTHARYADAMRALAARERIALIDLDAGSTGWLRALGEEASRPYYAHVPARGVTDDTHLSVAGATMAACLVVRDWKALDPALAAHVVRDTDCGAPDSAREDRAAQARPSSVVHESDFARPQPGPHGGPGATTAYPLFADAQDLPFVLRKRVLHKGAGIGLHQHHKDEIYYVLSGRGRYVLDGQVHEVGPGHAMLTRAGSTHAIQQAGEDDLVLLLAYPAH